MRRFGSVILVLLLAAGAAFWLLTMPRTIDPALLPAAPGDAERGAYIYHAAGCGSCHARPGAKGQDKLELAGGLGLKSPFGTFYAPNISSDRERGIGAWTTEQFANAVLQGVSPEGSHYYPAFPYPSYQNMTMEDVVDLKAFMDTLPAVASDAPAHDLAFPVRFRRGLGLWKSLFQDSAAMPHIPSDDAQIQRGAYLVHALGHCAECHTPRNIFGGLDQDRAFSGAADPDGDGFVPNITPHQEGIGNWTQRDITSALKTGILPDYDTFGGSMILVQENMSQLTEEDQNAIAAYLSSLPPKASWWRKSKD